MAVDNLCDSGGGVILCLRGPLEAAALLWPGFVWSYSLHGPADGLFSRIPREMDGGRIYRLLVAPANASC